MADLRGQELKDSYQNVVTRGTGATPIEDGNGSPYFYEEGTWTPTDASGANLTLSSSSQNRYVCVGNIVFLNYHLSYPETSDTSNTMIGGIPFSPFDSFSGGGGLSFPRVSDFHMSLTMISSAMRIYKSPGDNLRVKNNEISGKDIRGLITYIK